jgi:hypothetical protein
MKVLLDRCVLAAVRADLRQLEGIEPESRVYDSLVLACAAVSDLNLAMHAFKAMKVLHLRLCCITV